MQEANNPPFEKARLDQCIRYFEAEIARKERIENKSRFYMSFIAIVLGAIFLKPDFLTELVTILQQAAEKHPVATNISYAFLFILALFLCLSLLSILGVMSIKDYRRGTPSNLYSSLFAPYSKHYIHNNEASFYCATANTYTLSTEQNSNNNERKGKWLRLASFVVIGVLISLAGLISCFIFLLHK